MFKMPLHKAHNPNTHEGKTVQIFLTASDGLNGFTTSLRLGTSLAMVPRILRLDATRHTWRAPSFVTQIRKNPLPMVLWPKPSKYQTHHGGSRVFMGHKEMMQRSAFCSCCAQFVLIALVHGQWWEISISYIGMKTRTPQSSIVQWWIVFAEH